MACITAFYDVSARMRLLRNTLIYTAIAHGVRPFAVEFIPFCVHFGT